MQNSYIHNFHIKIFNTEKNEIWLKLLDLSFKSKRTLLQTEKLSGYQHVFKSLPSKIAYTKAVYKKKNVTVQLCNSLHNTVT